MTDQEDTQSQGTDDTEDLDLSIPEADTDVGKMQEDLAALRAQVSQLQTQLKAAQATDGADPKTPDLGAIEDALLENAPTTRYFKQRQDAEREDRENSAKLREARRAEEGRTFSAPHVAQASKEATRLRQEAQRAAQEHGLASKEFKEADDAALAAEFRSQGLQGVEHQADESARRGMERPDTTPSGTAPRRRQGRGEGLPGRGEAADRVGGSQTDAELADQLAKARRDG